MASSDREREFLAQFGDAFDDIVNGAEKRLTGAARIAVEQSEDDTIATMSLMTALITASGFQSPLVLSILLARRAIMDARLTQRNERRG